MAGGKGTSGMSGNFFGGSGAAGSGWVTDDLGLETFIDSPGWSQTSDGSWIFNDTGTGGSTASSGFLGLGKLFGGGGSGGNGNVGQALQLGGMAQKFLGEANPRPQPVALSYPQSPPITTAGYRPPTSSLGELERYALEVARRRAEGLNQRAGLLNSGGTM